MKKTFFTVATLLVLITGCASNSGVVPIGPDTYMVSRQAATGFTGLGTLKADAFREASAHCVSEGKLIRVTNTTENPGPYILGNFPRADIQFMCLGTGDVELTRPKMTQAADTVIKIEKEERIQSPREPSAQLGSNAYLKLKQLKKMKDEGLLDQTEYNKLKQEALKSMSQEN